ncbi:MAG TPA: EAL domain-containing protein [Burkholderiales bacterium]|nr:EAL domain-containing protein [Burkholderiales bacterium]
MTPPAHAPNQRPRERERLLLYLIPGLAALLVVTLFTLAAFNLAKARQSDLLDAGRATRNLAEALDEQTTRTLQSVEMVLVNLADTWAHAPAWRDSGNPEMRALLKQKLASLPYARAVFIVDAEGVITHHSDPHPTATSDFADREYFSWHRKRPHSFYVGKPILNRTTGAWFVAASRRLPTADGSFGGVIVVALEPRAFQAFYRNIDVGRKGAIELLHQDGELIARTPAAPTWVGMATGGNLALKDLARSGSYTFRTVSPVDGEARIYSARQVAGLPLMVQVGLSEEVVLTSWRDQRTMMIVVLTGFTLGIIVLAWLLVQELRRRSELTHSAAQSARLLHQVLDTLPVGVLVTDGDGTLVLGNTASKKIWGQAPSANMSGQGGLKGWRKDTGQRVEASDWGLAKALAKREVTSNQVIDIESGDGDRKTILDSAVPILSNDDEVIGAISLNEDITEQRALSESLRESEVRYRALFENSIDAILLTRRGGAIVAANDAACRLLDYDEEELRAFGRDDIVDSSDPRAQALLNQGGRAGVAHGEVRLRRKDGGLVPVEFACATFPERNGESCATLIIRDMTDRKRAEEHIEYLAYHDELTGIPNRAYFHRAFEHALATTQRYGLHCALMLVDLDRFKNINDTIGHEAGDQLLKQVASRLRACLRDSDIIARFGGDEFVILMQDASTVEAVNAVAVKILEATSRPLLIDDQDFLITASIGISTYPHDGNDMQTLLKNSDVAMYRAKEFGKNGFQYFSPEMNVHTRERLSIESALRRGLERKEFTVHFQPKVRVSSRTVAGMEALVRWRNPEKGLMQPSEFIAIAEETGIVVQIGDWVLEEACRNGQVLRKSGHTGLRVSVNLSVRQLFDRGFAQRVAVILEQTGFPAENLELEITESMVMRDAEGAVKVLQALRDTGVRLAIDDFGTGYSSLAYLKRFPINCVKIDRSFIRDLPDDRDDASITRGIIAMAHNMKLDVVAEGVETPEQLNFLQAYGCDEIQGFLFSEPLAADAFERYLGVPEQNTPVVYGYLRA